MKVEKYRIERIGEVGKSADVAESLLQSAGYDGMEFTFHRQIMVRCKSTDRARVLWAFKSPVFILYIDANCREYSMNRQHEFVHLSVCQSPKMADRITS